VPIYRVGRGTEGWTKSTQRHAVLGIYEAEDDSAEDGHDVLTEKTLSPPPFENIAPNA